MAGDRDDLIVVRDGDGHFYAFTPEQWAEARVPDDVQAALAEMFESDDTKGLIFDMGLAALNKYQQSLPTLSAVQRMQHERMMAIIGNLRA